MGSPNELKHLRARVAGLEDQLVQAQGDDTDTSGTEDVERYRRLIESIGVITWETDPETFQFTFVSEQAEAITGYAPKEWYQPGFWVDHIHPEDREHAVNYCRESTQRGESHDFRYRFIAKDGRTLWLRDLVTVVMDGNTPVQLRGVMIDITNEVEAQEARERSESMLQSMIASSSDILFRLNGDGMCLDVFTAKEGEMWIPPEQLRNRPITETLPLGQPQHSLSVIKRALETRTTQSFEYSEREVGEPDRYWEARIVPINSDEVIAHCRDITFEKQTRELYAEKERFLSTLIANLPGSVYRCRNDADWTMEYVSEGTAQITGYSPEAFVATRRIAFADLIHPDDRDRVWHEVQKAINECRAFDVSYRIRTASGNLRWVSEQGTGVFDERGNVIAVEGFVADITERVRAEQTLRRRLAAESLIASVSTDFINRPVKEVDQAVNDAIRELGRYTDADRCYLFLVDEGQKTFTNTHEWCAPGIEPQKPELQQCRLEEFAWSWDKLRRMEAVHLPTIADVPEDSVERACFESGNIRSLAFVPLAVRGEVFGLIGIDSVRTERTWPREDIALLRTVGEIVITALERRRAEIALRDSERNYKMLADNTSDMVSLHDLDGTFLYMSPSSVKVTGYEPEELIGQNAYEYFHPDDRERIRYESHLPAIQQGQAEIVWRFLTKSGKDVWCETRTTLIKDEAGRPHRLVCATRNITERKRIEAALKQSEQLFVRIFHTSPVPISITRLRDGSFIDANDALLQMYEMTREDVIGRTAVELGMWADPQDRERLMARLDNTHSIRNFEIRTKTQNGQFRNVLCFIERIRIGDEDCIVTLFHDITDIKRSEEEMKRANARQRLLLRELDHRVRNNLASLAALIDLSSRNATDVQEFAASVRGRVHAMSAVHGLLSRGRWSTVHLKELLFALLPRDLHDQITFQGSDVVLAAMQGTAMGMILQELIANSLKYGSLSVPHGRVRIESTVTDAEDGADLRQLELHWHEADGPAVLEQTTHGLGTTLIQGIVRSELRGTVKLAYPATGAEHHFMLQLDPVTENGP